MPTPTLRAFLPPLRLEIAPLAHLDASGRLTLEGPEFPREGATLIALWRPGASPAFVLARVEVRRAGAAWRAEPGSEGWVVAWVSEGALGTQPPV